MVTSLVVSGIPSDDEAILRWVEATRYGQEWRSEIEPYTKATFLHYEGLGKELAKANCRYNNALRILKLLTSTCAGGKAQFGWSYSERTN